MGKTLAEAWHLSDHPRLIKQFGVLKPLMYQYGEKVIQQRQRWVLDLKANLAARHFQNRLATVPLTVRTRLSFPIPTWQSSVP